MSSYSTSGMHDRGGDEGRYSDSLFKDEANENRQPIQGSRTTKTQPYPAADTHIAQI